MKIQPVFIVFILLAMSLTLFLERAQAREVTPQEINAKKCKEYVDSLFDHFPHFQKFKYLTKENSTLNCINEMNNNYKNGLPNYATHTNRDVENYREEKQKRINLEFRDKNKNTLQRIARSCAKPVYTFYSGMYSQKIKGVPKEDQVKALRMRLHTTESNTIIDGILINLAFEALDDIYSKSGPTNYDQAAEHLVMFYGKCTELYEQALFLR